MHRRQKACRHLRNTRKGLRGLPDQSRKGYSDDNADSTDRGVPLRYYDPKLVRAWSRFEALSTPRNEGNSRLRTKTVRSSYKDDCERHRNVGKDQLITRVAQTRRRGGIRSHHAHDAGERWSKKENWANLQRFCELIP